MTPSPVWRLRGASRFARLGVDGRRIRSGPLWIRWAPPLDAAEPARVAFAISRRVGGAVVRNRLRRRLRAVLVDLQPASGDYLVGGEPAVALLTYAELHALVVAALAKCGEPTRAVRV